MAKSTALKKMRSLTELQRRFAEAYVWETRGNALAAWRVMHPASKANHRTAVKDSQRLMRRPAVQAEIAEQQAQRRVMLMTNYGVTVERTVQELAAIGYADMRDYLKFDDNGQVLVDWSGMSEMASKAIAEITQDEFVEGRGDTARIVRRTKFKLHDKGGALSDLARHLDMFKGKGDDGDEGKHNYLHVTFERVEGPKVIEAKVIEEITQEGGHG